MAIPSSRADSSIALPPVLDDGWQTTADPQASGFDAAALCAVLQRVAGDAGNIHGVVVERRARLVAELYRRGKDKSIWSLFARETDFAPTVLHDLRSVSKSVVGLLVGIARQQGKIDVAASALAYYPGYADLRSPERAAITVEPLTPGKVYNFSVQVWPTSYVFQAGHRIRVDLSGSDCCAPVGEDPNPNAARVTVYQDAGHPSSIDIPVIGAIAWQNLLGHPAAAGKGN